jgi:hypothetical protein
MFYNLGNFFSIFLLDISHKKMNSEAVQYAEEKRKWEKGEKDKGMRDRMRGERKEGEGREEEGRKG